MAPLGKSHTSSHCRSVVTMTLSCIISLIKPDIGQKSRFFIPHAFDVLIMGSSSVYCHKISYWKLPDSEKKFENMFTRFDTIHQHDGKTVRQTDTTRQHRPRLCVASSGKNVMNKTSM